MRIKKSIYCRHMVRQQRRQLKKQIATNGSNNYKRWYYFFIASNAKLGQSQWMVVEADESDGSFKIDSYNLSCDKY